MATAAVFPRAASTIVWAWIDAAGRQGQRACGSPLSMGGCGRRPSGSRVSGERCPSLGGLPASPNRFSVLQGLDEEMAALRPTPPKVTKKQSRSPKKKSTQKTYVEVARVAGTAVGLDASPRGRITPRRPDFDAGVRGAAPPVLVHDGQEKGAAGTPGAVRPAAAPRAGASHHQHTGLPKGRLFVDHVEDHDDQGESGLLVDQDKQRAGEAVPVLASRAGGATAAATGGLDGGTNTGPVTSTGSGNDANGGGRGHAPPGAGPGGGGGAGRGGGGTGRDGGGGGGGRGGGRAGGGGGIAQFYPRPLPSLLCAICPEPALVFLGCCRLTAVCSAHRCHCLESGCRILPLPIVPYWNMTEVILYQHFPIPPSPWMLVKAERLGDTIRYHYVSVLQVVGMDPSGVWNVLLHTYRIHGGVGPHARIVQYKETKHTVPKTNYYP